MAEEECKPPKPLCLHTEYRAQVRVAIRWFRTARARECVGPL